MSFDAFAVRTLQECVDILVQTMLQGVSDDFSQVAQFSQGLFLLYYLSYVLIQSFIQFGSFYWRFGPRNVLVSASTREKYAEDYNGYIRAFAS